MKKKMYQDEELLRDKMLRHEFEPDESAWEGMEALLNGVPGPAPTTALPTAVAASGLLAKVGAWPIWAGGLSLAVLVVVLATKWATPSPTTPRTEVAATPSIPLRSEGNAPHASPAHSTAGPYAARPADEKPTDDQAFRSQAPVSPSASAAARQQMKAAPRSKHAAPPALPAPTLPNGPEKGHAASAQPAAAPSEMSAQNTLPGTLTEGKEDFATPGGKSASALPALPSLAQALSGPALQPPTLEQVPAPLITRKHVQRHDQQGRFQVGAALGGQWTVVNRAINKVALLPTYGFSLNARISPRWWAETGLMYRQVKGYDLTAQWRDAGISLDGKYGSWASGVSAKQLNYLEMPLLIKYAMPNGDQRLMLGLRAARMYPKAGGSFSSSANSYSVPQDFQPDIRQGFRRYDLALSVGVEARVRSNVWLDIRHNEGLYDLTYDNFFNNTQVDRTMETQVTLRYYFGSFW